MELIDKQNVIKNLKFSWFDTALDYDEAIKMINNIPTYSATEEDNIEE